MHSFTSVYVKTGQDHLSGMITHSDVLAKVSIAICIATDNNYLVSYLNFTFRLLLDMQLYV